MYPHAIAVVYVLAVMRLTRLVNYDTVLDPVRVRIAQRRGKDSTLLYFIMCPWCVGVWVALATVWIPMWFAHLWFVQYLGIALAVSQVVGMLAPFSSDEDMDIETVVNE